MLTMKNYKQIRKENLRALIKQFGSQQKLADACNTDKSYFSQILSPKDDKQIGDHFARKIELAAGKPPHWLDIEHPEPIADILYANANLLKEERQNYVSEWQKKEDLTDFVYIKYVSCKLSAGLGALVYDESDKTPRAMHKSWLIQTGLKAEDLVAFKISGWSMSPYIEDGDIVMINTNTNGLSIVDNAAYAIRYGDELRVKRLVRRFDGTVIIKSDNPDKSVYPDETLTPESAADLVVLGKVVWRGG